REEHPRTACAAPTRKSRASTPARPAIPRPSTPPPTGRAGCPADGFSRPKAHKAGGRPPALSLWARVKPSRRSLNDVQQAPGRGVDTRKAIAPRGQQLAGDGLAQLDPPLVEGVDVPQPALGKHLVLVKGNQRPQVAEIGR